MKPREAWLVLALCAVPGLAVADQAWREQSRRTIPAAGIEQLVVENARGRIEVHPSRDADLHVTALKIARANSESEARTIASAATVQLRKDGKRYVIRVRYPQKESVHVNFWDGFDLSMPRLEVRLSVDVPSALAVQLISSSGDLFTYDLSGVQRLKATSGDVSVEGASGSVDVTTSSGDVSLTDARAVRAGTSSGDVEVVGKSTALQISTASGDVSIEDMADSVKVETTSGDVSVESAGQTAMVSTSSGEVHLGEGAGRVSISTVSGEIHAGVAMPLREAAISTSSGDIRVGLATDVGCTIEMRTSSGSLDIDVPVRTQTLTRRLVTGVVRDGAAPVKLRSVSGSIAVVSGEP